MLVFSHYSAALGASDTEVQTTLSQSLPLLLGLLEKNAAARLHLSLSGPVLEKLEKEIAEQIVALAKRRQIEIIATLAFEPQLTAITAAEISAQLQYSLSIWKKFGIENISAVRLPPGWNDQILPALAKQNIRVALLPLRDFTDPGIVSCLKDEASGIFILPYEDRTFKDSLSSANKHVQYWHLRPEAYPETEEEIVAFIGTVESAVANNSELLPDYLLTSAIQAVRLEAGKQLRITELAAEVPPKQPALRVAYCRIRQLGADLQRAWETINARPHREANSDRLKLANDYVLRAQAGDLYRFPAEQGSSSAARHEVFAAALKAQVEIDTANHPEVDPVHGWVEHQSVDCDFDGENEIIIDTQLARLYIKPSLGGSMQEFDYKPRKIDLANTVTTDFSRALCFVDGLVALNTAQETSGLDISQNVILPQVSPAKMLVTKHSLDLLSLRFTRQLACKLSNGSMYEATLIKDLTIKAGIGAHLNNATTGLTLEFWLEAKAPPPAGVYLCNQFAFLLPSANPGTMSLRPLTSVGAALEHVLPFDKAATIRAADAPAGLHGARLIDGLEQFVMDLRTAKPLHSVLLDHLIDASVNAKLARATTDEEKVAAREKHYNGTLLHFVNDATRIFEDHRSQTIFLSIQ